MFRYFIYLAYDGTNYHGWQIQPNGSSVQETLMKALHTFLRDEAIEVVGAGRTDAGVHARLMVAHFDVEWMLDEDTVTDKLNRLLPPDISVYRVRRVNQDAHARFDATYRTYKYYVTTQKNPFNRARPSPAGTSTSTCTNTRCSRARSCWPSPPPDTRSSWTRTDRL